MSTHSRHSQSAGFIGALATQDFFVRNSGRIYFSLSLKTLGSDFQPCTYLKSRVLYLHDREATVTEVHLDTCRRPTSGYNMRISTAYAVTLAANLGKGTSLTLECIKSVRLANKLL